MLLGIRCGGRAKENGLRRKKARHRLGSGWIFCSYFHELEHSNPLSMLPLPTGGRYRAISRRLLVVQNRVRQYAVRMFQQCSIHSRKGRRAEDKHAHFPIWFLTSVDLANLPTDPAHLTFVSSKSPKDWIRVVSPSHMPKLADLLLFY